MTAVATFFHIGILVDDLDKAIERFSNVLEVNFLPPTVIHIDQLQESDRKSNCDLRLTFSAETPHYELLEAQGDGIFGLHHGVGLHHIGVWEPDCESRLQRMTHHHRLEEEAIAYTADRRISVAYLKPEGLYGTRIELCDEADRASVEKWIAAGTLNG
jgi:hypothetical protein